MKNVFGYSEIGPSLRQFSIKATPSGKFELYVGNHTNNARIIVPPCVLDDIVDVLIGEEDEGMEVIMFGDEADYVK